MLYQGELKNRFESVEEAKDFIYRNEECYIHLIEKYSIEEVVTYISKRGKAPSKYKRINGVYCNSDSNSMRNTILPLTFGDTGFHAFPSCRFNEDIHAFIDDCNKYTFHSDYGFTDNIDKFLSNTLVAKYLNREDRIFIIEFSDKKDVKNSDIYSRGKNGSYYGTNKGKNNKCWYMFHIYEVLNIGEK